MRAGQMITSWCGRHGWLVAGAAALVIFGWLHSTDKFSDPDAYYHAALVRPAISGQLLHTLPQAWFTELRDNYVDHHLLYHIILGLFVLPLGMAVGLKAASVVLAAMMVAVFHWVGRRLGVRQMWIITLLLLTSPGWLYRLGLVKATSLALIILLLGILLTVNKKPLALGALAWVFVYLYGGFALLPGAVSAMLIVDWLVAKYWNKNGAINSLAPRWPLAAAVWSGTLLGIIISPNFPGNLAMYFSQLVAIGVVNYSLVISVGSEWYSLTIGGLWTLAGTAFLLLVLTAPLAFLARQARSNIHIILTALSAAVLIFTFKSQRYVEYFTPVSLLAAGVVAQAYVSKVPWAKLSQWLARQETGWRRKFKLALMIMVCSLALIGAQGVWAVRQQLNYGSPARGLTTAYQWLKYNLPPQTLIYNVNWGDWPLLFYGAPQFRYIVGLDPTFMYRAWPELAKKYQAIGWGQLTGQELVDTITNDFGARYILVTNSSLKAKQQLALAPQLLKLFADDDGVIIYKIEP